MVHRSLSVVCNLLVVFSQENIHCNDDKYGDDDADDKSKVAAPGDCKTFVGLCFQFNEEKKTECSQKSQLHLSKLNTAAVNQLLTNNWEIEI